MRILTGLIHAVTHPLAVYGLTGAAVYLALYALYEPITLGFDLEDITVLAIPTILGLFLFQYFMNTSVWHVAFAGHALVGIGWALTFPLLFHYSYEKPFYLYEFSDDFLFGLLLFVGLVATHYLATLPQRYLKSIAAFFTLLDVILALIPLGQIGYYLSVGHCITPATLSALYMTNPEEALGYLKTGLGPTGLALSAVGIFVWIGCLYLCNVRMIYVSDAHTTRPLRLAVLLTSVAAFLWYVPFVLFPQTCIARNWIEVDTYMKELQSFSAYHKESFESFGLDTYETAAKTTPGAVIVVIGESASRDYMKVYTPSFPYDDTPWQSHMEATDSDFILFRHAYASYVQTVPTVRQAMTEKNQYNDRPFLGAATILDIAKKAGYTTSWLSNQGVYGDYDSEITLIAKTADHVEWSHESYAFSDKYDGELLPLLKKLDPSKSNFIVLHIMGSHIYYNDRYPSEFSKWKQGPYPTGIEAYANSQLYTDWLLGQIYEYAKTHLNLQAMMYFSDHGESIDKSHNPDNFNFEMTRIPFWIYLSPTYRSAYPETAEVLDNRRIDYFTNDLVYDTLVGIMQAPNVRYDATRDFSSPLYRFDEYNLTTLQTTIPLTDDPKLRE